MNLLSDIAKGLVVAVVAALIDSAKNVFRPVHNAKILLGIEEEESISSILENTRERLNIDES